MNRSDESGLCFIAKPFSVVSGFDVVVVSSTIRLHSTGGKSWYSGGFGRIMWPKFIERPKARLREALL